MQDDRLTDIKRLSELEKYTSLDRESGESFDRFCLAVRNVLSVPFAAFTLVGHHGAWNVGMSAIDPDVSMTVAPIARATVLRRETVVIGDVEREGMGKGVTEPCGRVRSAIAAPILVEDGICLGALVAADTAARNFDEHEVELLEQLARIAVDQLSLNRLRHNYARKAEVSRRQAEKLKSQQVELRRLHKLFDNASSLARIGGWEYDFATEKVGWSSTVYSIFDLPPDTSIKLDKVLSYFPEEVRGRLMRIIASRGESGSFDIEAPLLTDSGSVKWVRIIGEVERTDGEAVRLGGTIQDISDQKERERQLEQLARHDVLTGLANRQLFHQELDAAIANADSHGGGVALMLIDVDLFKTVNDNFGHDCGDRLLKEFARRLRATFRGGDTISRLGGDEFAVVLPGITDTKKLNEIAERLQRDMSLGFDVGEMSVDVGASIGIALYPDHASDSVELLKQADIALYSSKSAGRARHCFYENAMGEQIRQRHTSILAIRNAVASREVMPFYQPIMRANDFSLAGFEALVRWVKADGQVMTPAFFLAALNDPTMSCLIGEVMIASVANQIMQWGMDGLPPIPVSVNVAPEQIARPEFAAALLNICSVHGIKPGHLNVEITENVLLSKDKARTMRAFETLAKGGVKIDLDDFGTGYASLVHLKEYPFDRIKIDRSFIAQLPEDAESLGIVKAVIRLAHDLRKQVVAEGVETMEQANLLARLGCDLLQGYLFSKPLPAGAAGEFARSRQTAARRAEAGVVPMRAAKRA
ncbi:MAG: putative bifunctional diguanylate cyclase/phosphodiesterase [Parvibaculaceae bacterium]